jgi:hypothetical protein
LLISVAAFAQKRKWSDFNIQPPKREKNSAKVGFVGKEPGRKKKIKFNSSASSKSKNSRIKKVGKTGYVGDDPSLRPKKVKYMKPSAGKSPRVVRYLPDNKIKKPRRKTDFIAADKNPQNKNLRIPKTVNDKQMLLPKKRFDKGAPRKVKMDIKGMDPGTIVNNNKEKRVNDIQYRSAYKYDKKGTENKKFFRRNKKD